MDAKTSRPDILTASGKYFNFVDTEANEINVLDIAHALSHVCRFAGHVREFYSVAQHSYFCSFLVPPEDALQALFHDATEAYIGDVTRPLKALLPDYRRIEERLHNDIFTKLGLSPDLPRSVKHADLILLATEQRDLMPSHSDEWLILAGISPMPETIIPWSPAVAKTKFVERYYKLSLEFAGIAGNGAEL